MSKPPQPATKAHNNKEVAPNEETTPLNAGTILLKEEITPLNEETTPLKKGLLNKRVTPLNGRIDHNSPRTISSAKALSPPWPSWKRSRTNHSRTNNR